MTKPRYKDDDCNWTYEGDTITFSFGIPPLKVTAKIMNRSGSLWVFPDNRRYAECPLRALRGYVGAWWKEEA